jgi:hypothetical protein
MHMGYPWLTFLIVTEYTIVASISISAPTVTHGIALTPTVGINAKFPTTLTAAPTVVLFEHTAARPEELR